MCCTKPMETRTARQNDHFGQKMAEDCAPKPLVATLLGAGKWTHKWFHFGTLDRSISRSIYQKKRGHHKISSRNSGYPILAVPMISGRKACLWVPSAGKPHTCTYIPPLRGGVSGFFYEVGSGSANFMATGIFRDSDPPPIGLVQFS